MFRIERYVDQAGQAWIETVNNHGPGIVTERVRLDEDEQPVDKDGRWLEFVNGRWQVVDING